MRHNCFTDTHNVLQRSLTKIKITNCLLTCVKALHSTYFTALSSLASFSPCSPDIGFCLFFASFSIVATSSLKSICVPTSKNGVLWQWCVISGTHCKIIYYYNRISFNIEGMQKHNADTIPFLLHFRTTMVIQLRSIRETRRSEDNLKDAIYHNLPDLKNKK